MLLVSGLLRPQRPKKARTSSQKSAARSWQRMKRSFTSSREISSSCFGRIEDAVPLINLAIQASGATLSSQLPHTVSPSRLLQASTFLTAGDTQYQISPRTAVQIGPTFNLDGLHAFRWTHKTQRTKTRSARQRGKK